MVNLADDLGAVLRDDRVFLDARASPEGRSPGSVASISDPRPVEPLALPAPVPPHTGWCGLEP